MDLSVVIATTEAARSIEACLDHVEAACAGLQAEVIVVDASADDTADRASRTPSAITLLRYAPGTLTPRLWAEGYRRSTGRRVAFTTGHCLVSRGWATSLMAALDTGAAGAGGALTRADGITALDRAIYYLRYSAFMPETLGDGRTSGEIAGDNAMYARDWLDRFADTMADGFWEVDFHRHVRGAGGWLVAVPTAVMAFSRSFPAATILRHRFHHGAQFGAGRIADGTRSVWQMVLAAPLVPLVLAARVARRVLGIPRERWSVASALPWFVVLAAAWAAGEAWGAITAEPRGAREGGA